MAIFAKDRICNDMDVPVLPLRKVVIESTDVFTLDLTKPNAASLGVSSADQATIDELKLRVREMEECEKSSRI